MLLGIDRKARLRGRAAGGETMFLILPPLSFISFGKRNLPIPGCRIG
jgi:hypothetical protein